MRSVLLLDEEVRHCLRTVALETLAEAFAVQRVCCRVSILVNAGLLTVGNGLSGDFDQETDGWGDLHPQQ